MNKPFVLDWDEVSERLSKSETWRREPPDQPGTWEIRRVGHVQIATFIVSASDLPWPPWEDLEWRMVKTEVMK